MLVFGAAMVAIMIWRPRGLRLDAHALDVLHERKPIVGATRTGPA